MTEIERLEQLIEKQDKDIFDYVTETDSLREENRELRDKLYDTQILFEDNEDKCISQNLKILLADLEANGECYFAGLLEDFFFTPVSKQDFILYDIIQALK